MKYLDLSGTWKCEIPGMEAEIHLPGTLDENGIGFPDDPAKQWKAEEVQRIGFWQPGDPIVTRLTRKHTFEGCARISRTVEWKPTAGMRAFVDVERARQLRLLVNGKEAPLYRPGCLSAPWCFEVTGLVTGHDEITFLSDNSYPGWPREAIVYGSAASDETQTNWNGLLGGIGLREEDEVFISDLRVYPRGDELRVILETDALREWSGEFHFRSDALERTAAVPMHLAAGRQETEVTLRLKDGAEKWEIGEGKMYTLVVTAAGIEPQGVRFGIRDFSAKEGHLTLNGRKIFLRSEANCAVFPETGYCPMDVGSWKGILQKYRDYGVNCMRFHSHCPPEAAFTAADEMGMLMQPELSHWDPEHAFESEEARAYYRTELRQILRSLACHPSFVMLTFGNELQAGETGHAFMDTLLKEAREYDGTRMYASGSNAHYGEKGEDPQSDFYTSMSYFGREMRATCDGMKGWLNHEYPSARHDYSATMAEIRKRTEMPVFSFEVGQYEVLPELGEIGEYRGVTRPENLRQIQKKVREKGLEEGWARRVAATGENSLQCYRAEVEAAMRTEGYSGISLLGLQDFPGQGTALVGMMNAHLEPKPGDFARPERFAAFFRDALPLVLLKKYTYTAGEELEAEVRMANYGRKELSGRGEWTIEGEGFRASGEMTERTAPEGGLTDIGVIRTELTGIEKPVKLTLTVRFGGEENKYPLWVYPDGKPECPEEVYECRSFDEKARETLRRGGKVYLAPDSTAEALPHSIQAQFSPDFWSVCTFPYQEGGMGQLIDEGHPIFRDFPTESWSSWQWWPMAGQRAMILPERIECIVEEMDSYAFLRPMAKLFECRCGGGKLMVSSMGMHGLMEYPEARALQRAIYRYMGSEEFLPRGKVSMEWVERLMGR